MREGTANGGVDRAGGGADAAAAAAAAVPMEAGRRQKQPSSSGSTASSSSSSGGGGAAEEEQGGKNKQDGRRRSKRREEVMRAIRDRLPAAPSCWGNGVSVVQERRGRPDDRGRNGAVEALQEEGRSGAGTAALPAWCCLCPEGDCCSLEANPSANGKEDPGLRALLERNDFYSDDCNPHAPAAVNDDDDGGGGFETPAADFG